MEPIAEVEQNHQKSEPIAKSSGSLIRVESLYVDLAGAMDNHQESNKCEHFLIREYVAEMREKDINVNFPFSIDENQTEIEEKKSILPPLDVVKFKRWSCHKCLREIGDASCAQEIEKIPDSVFLSKDSCSIKEHLNDATMEENAAACAESNRDEILISSRNNDTEKNDNVGQMIADVSENDASDQILPATKEIINSEPELVPERHADGSDAIGRNISGSTESSEPSLRGYISSNIRPLESNKSDSIDFDQTGTSNPPNGKQILEIGDSEILPKVDSVGVKNNNANISRSLDDISSGSSKGIAKNGNNEKFVEISSKSIRERAPKVRLLADILGSYKNKENDQSRKADSDSASAFRDEMNVQMDPKHSKGKRKITQDENGKTLFENSQNSNGKADFAKRNCVDVNSDSEENIEKHASSKKKQKQTPLESVFPFLTPRPDVTKKYYFSGTGEGISRPAYRMNKNIEIDPYNKNSLFSLQAEKKSNMGGCSWIRKGFDAYGRKGIDLSLDSYEMMRKNKESSIFKSKIGAESSSLPWISALRERCHKAKDDIFLHGEAGIIRKNASDLNSGKGFLYDLNEKIATQSPVRERQNAIPVFGKRTTQQYRELNMSGNLNIGRRNDDRDKGDEDIPMEIVELLAKNRYEKRRHELETNYLAQKRSNEKRKFESMGLSRTHGNESLRPYQVEDHNVRQYFSQTTMAKSSDYFASIKERVNNSLDTNGTRLNTSNFDGKKSAFSSCGSIFDGQGTQSGRVNYPGYGSVGNSNYQKFNWKNDNIDSSYLRAPTYTNFPPNYAPRASNFGTNSQIPSRGNVHKGIDLNFIEERYRNFEKQNRDLGAENVSKGFDLNFLKEKYRNFEKQKDLSVETNRKSSEFDLFSLNSRGIDLNNKVSGSIGLSSKEAIPAMHSLGLMDDGKKKNPIFNSDGKQKMIFKPLPSRDYQPKVLEKPLLFSDYSSKELFGKKIGESSNGSIPSSSNSYLRNQWRDKYFELPPPTSAFGPFSSSFRKESNLKEGNGVQTRVPPKFEEKKKGSPEKSMEKRKNIDDSNTNNQRGQEHMSGTVTPSQRASGTESCDFNRNPADFGVPEPGNIYTIDGKDLKVKKRISSRGKNVSTGKKRQKGAAPKTQ